ncbi:hypothetical protein BKN14_03285 [Candidatus Gracilibacteria bacterium HOT-871]|nr:hypothetical protein BKN14_03285 [Candidatus Gracilibacteria bacterium HOT-871]MBB1564682.1 hypothetical protein [Candidatus Gracilibacteria bacterium]RKW22439.1 MAG: hypothetical protein D8B46_05420 [Candidatus Gracilibacteria bacterium]
MRKIIFGILAIFLLISSFVSDTQASQINVGGNNNIIRTDTKIPYCPNPGDCSLDKGIEESKGKIDGIKSDGTAADYIQDIIIYVLGFLFLITVIIIIWAGAIILTSAGNDDKVENAKKIIINCVIGMVVIFAAYPISSFIIGIFIKTR